MDFIDTIDKLGLKANSAKNYVRSLTRLQKLYEMPLTQAISEDSELTTFNKLFDGKSHHTKKSYLVAVHAFICGKSMEMVQNAIMFMRLRFIRRWD